MSAAMTRPLSTPSSVTTNAAVLVIVAGSVVVTTALLVVVTGECADARRALGFGFGGVDRSLAQASSIAVHNAKLAGATLLCGAVAPRLPVAMRVAIDLLLALLLVVNAGAIGVAFGAYGWRAIAATAPHLPLEFAGLSLAGAAYLHARNQRPLSQRAIAAVAGGCAVLLAAAAALETYVSLEGTR
jgi:hypothetical protein